MPQGDRIFCQNMAVHDAHIRSADPRPMHRDQDLFFVDLGNRNVLDHNFPDFMNTRCLHLACPPRQRIFYKIGILIVYCRWFCQQVYFPLNQEELRLTRNRIDSVRRGSLSDPPFPEQDPG